MYEFILAYIFCGQYVYLLANLTDETFKFDGLEFIIASIIWPVAICFAALETYKHRKK